jgi:hypothetical protein
MITLPEAGTIVPDRLTHTLLEVAVVVLFVSIHPDNSLDEENEVELKNLTLDIFAFKWDA